MPLKILLATAVVAVFSGCAQPVPKSIPGPQGTYIPPPESPSTARLEGTITSLLGTRTRARVESVEFQGVRIVRESADQPPVVLLAGKRSLVVICETNFATSSDRTDIEFDVLAGHEYILTCGTANLWSHTGSDFKITDKTSGNKVVATGFGPGRAYPPRGRIF